MGRVSKLSVIVTKHAEKRLEQRSGLSKKSIQRMAEKAYEEGIAHKDTKGNLNKWVTSLYFNNQKANNIRLYGDKAFIFTGSTLITVLQIPSSLTKDMKKLVKIPVNTKEE